MAVPVVDAGDSDLINFDIIENHKENIQSLPGGRSAKQLASMFTPSPAAKDAEPTLSETKTLNDAIRQEYETELQSIADSDDPLDIYDRYMKWTLNAYPSAQTTPQSKLLPLLERATKAFLTSAHYKNDPRYLKLWLHYIRLFADTPRETFAFLARHGIGEKLGLFYEEFAAWLEGAGRWVQADEVYNLGIEREARPTERLVRKYGQFQQRFNARPDGATEPTSPALPTVRPALAAKIDPFAPAPPGDDPQARWQPRAGGATGSSVSSRSGRPKMAVFADVDDAAPPPGQAASNTTNGWDNIGSLKDRKKENVMEPRPWTGEKLKAGGKVGTVAKMEVFKDPKRRDPERPPPKTRSTESRSTKPADDVVNPRTGRPERAFVNIQAVYPPNSREEFSFEELRAISRGWAAINWKSNQSPQLPRYQALRPTAANATSASDHSSRSSGASKSQEPEDVENLSHSFQQKIELHDEFQPSVCIHDVSTQSMVGMPQSQPLDTGRAPTTKAKEKKLKVREVRQETQTVKTRLESPAARKLKRKNTAEPTMTLHSKAATNEIYDMFNQPLRRTPMEAPDAAPSGDDTEDGTESEMDDGYSTNGDGESTGTGRLSVPGSEFGDSEDTRATFDQDTNTESLTSAGPSQSDSVSPWSDFTASKHVPRLDDAGRSQSVRSRGSSGKKRQLRSKSSKSRSVIHDDMTDSIHSSSQNATQTSGQGAFDTQAIAAIANGQFDDMDTKAIALLAGDVDVDDEFTAEDTPGQSDVEELASAFTAGSEPPPISHESDSTPDGDSDVTTPTEVDESSVEHIEIPHQPRFVPIPPIDYEPTLMRPFRDPEQLAHHKLPFMTPIVERTESSVAPSTVFNDPDYFSSKTPSRSRAPQHDSPSRLTLENLLMSSPVQDEGTPTSTGKRKIGRGGATEEEADTSSPRRKKGGDRDTAPGSPVDFLATVSPPVLKIESPTKRPALQPTVIRKGPLVQDSQCNPCSDAVRQQILTAMHPPLSSYPGYHDQADTTCNQYQTLKSFGDKVAKGKSKGSPRKSQTEKTLTKAAGPVLKFGGTTRVYAVKRQLGQGAFAPVYLVESQDSGDTDEKDDENKENLTPPPHSGPPGRSAMEAVKSESPPGTLVWEFHILRMLRHRLGPASRTMQSIVLAHECHLYRDEAYLVLAYVPHGTLLDLVNAARQESIKAGKPAEGLDEVLAMFFSVELLRTMEELHLVGILHGDLKIDNCLARFDANTELSGPYNGGGDHGWSGKGLTVIDFGRGIDVRMFAPQATFIADWPAGGQDCAEIRECRPWKYQIDYHGAAAVMHSLLFGKYIETVPASTGAGLGLGQKREWKLKESLKRYWEKDLWTDIFTTLLNPGLVADGEEMPIHGNVKRLRIRMEQWLADEGERGGRDLRGSLKRMERLVACK